MNQNNLTLVIDGNWLMMSRFFMKRDSFRKDLDEEIKRNSSEQLADLMAQSISVLLRQFQGNITNIIFVSDNRSWRKDYPVPECITNTAVVDTYKGTRSQSGDYDMKYVFNSISILTKRFDNLGVTTSNAYGVEGDDWCWWWSRKLNAEGINVLLWTSDEDVKQLIQEDPETGAFTAWYEKSKGIALNESMKTEEDKVADDDDLGFFMTPLKYKNPLIENLKHIANVTYINPAEIINKKIYVGDSGDNIMPVFTYSKHNKTYKATTNDWKKIISFGEYSFSKNDWDTYLPAMYSKVYNIKKGSIGENPTDLNSFQEHARYNRKMVWLNESQIPDNIQAQMSTVDYKEMSSDFIHDITYNWKILSGAEQDNTQDLFDMPDFMS